VLEPHETIFSMGPINMINQLSDNSSRILPDINVCRAKDNGITKFADCLVVQPSQCPYALSIRDSFYCYHPNRKIIIQNTIDSSEEYLDKNGT